MSVHLCLYICLSVFGMVSVCLSERGDRQEGGYEEQPTST